ncbi:3-hydroxyacyl-CoA dehydrogenase NAD-binding domain-containing protein [Bradyrhizobium huanghuaihaiense]|uniref:3-hydroxyacyl-CoA dehydrogenase NAD-binding domain-containing protein n=1 Tax=Bradyrhizobium huanghuaihaiense TaxID=990078 RepID=UPI0021AA9178|nr:3-hydroxyacyl-CoA dehydrogenase NAD-binding domain-containing protein [Bradyrhizobium sp. CB3035]UWU75815.1 3-hydroxyacyl-CoA dehydrogenase NAD-binding domain-containing protein [Bradyrhizobium sp. CB3035]
MSGFRGPDRIRRVACLGTGLIGGGFVALFLARGLDVVVWDPAADARDRLDQLLATAWPTLERLGARAEDRGTLSWASTAAEAVTTADFVQENAPDRLELKRSLYSVLEPLVPADVVIASSTSGFTVTDLQAGGLRSPRVVVGHPFNPPYLIPLVEVAGAPYTSREALAAVEAFYQSIGKVVIRMDHEIPGFIANHLQAALEREAIHLVAEGHATPQQIDTAIVHGLAPRWTAIGPFMVRHLANVAGVGAYFERFPLGSEPLLSHLRPPEGTPKLIQAMEEGCRAMAADRDRAALAAARDRMVIETILAQRRAKISEHGI